MYTLPGSVGQQLSSLRLKMDIYMGSNPTSPAPAAGSDVLRTTEPLDLSPAASPLCRWDVTKSCQAARSPLPLPAEPQTETLSINNDSNSKRELRGAGNVAHFCTWVFSQDCRHGALRLLKNCSWRARPCSSSPGLYQLGVRQQRGLMPSTVSS